MRLLVSLVVLGCAPVTSAAALPTTGPHKVEHIGQRNFVSPASRTVGIEIWHPVDRNGGPFPLLVFSPGFGNKPSQYLSQLEELASHGYVIAGLEHPPDSLDSFEGRAVLWAQDILAAKQEVLGSPVRAIVDGARIGTFGHSLGGRAAAGACLLDPSILACLNQDGGDAEVQLKRPYWPIASREFAGAFAMLDWFDPGLDDQDLRAMGMSLEQYAASRLVPSPAALNAYQAVRRGGYRITMLTPGMRHTASTDDPWSTASSDPQRNRYADYLRQVRAITLNFFEKGLNADSQNSACAGAEKGILIQCFGATRRITPQ